MKGNKINEDDVEPLYRIVFPNGASVREIDFKDMGEVEEYLGSSYFLAGVILGRWIGPDEFDVVELASGKIVGKPPFLRRACIENKCGVKVNSFEEMVRHRQESAHSSPFIRYPEVSK